MTTANTDRWRAIAGQIRLNVLWCAIGPSWFGLELGAAMWRTRDDFYPFSLIAWGLITVFYVYRTLVQLHQSSYTVPLAQAEGKKKEARPLMAYVLGVAFTSFFFALSLAAAKSFGRFYAVSSVVLGALTILVILKTELKIRQFSRSF